MFKFLLYVFLSLIYFFILTPFALLMKFSGKKSLNRGNNKNTYWKQITTDSADKKIYERFY